MFWPYNRYWDAFNKFIIVYYKTLGTAFAAILKHQFCLETGVSFFFFFFFFFCCCCCFCLFLFCFFCFFLLLLFFFVFLILFYFILFIYLFILLLLFFLATYLRLSVGNNCPDGVKRRKGSLASGKTCQNLIHTDIELEWFAKHQTGPLLVQLVIVINAY